MGMCVGIDALVVGKVMHIIKPLFIFSNNISDINISNQNVLSALSIIKNIRCHKQVMRVLVMYIN